METIRKFQEKAHGRKIQSKADKIWGWDTPAGVFRSTRRLNEFLQYLTLAKRTKVLEIGCGTGVFTNLFYKNGITPIAIDISYDLLRKAKNKNHNIFFIQADAENLPFKENTFDCVLGVSVLHHLNTNSAFKAIRAVLTDGGSIIFSEPNMANPQIFLQKRISWLKRMLRDTPNETAFFRWKLKKTLEQNGFSQVYIYPFEFLHPLTPVPLIYFIKKLERCLERTPIFREIAGSLLICSKK